MKERVVYFLIFLIAIFPYLTLCSSDEPVEGIEVFVKKQPSGKLIKKCITDQNGEFFVTLDEIRGACDTQRREVSPNVEGKIKLLFEIIVPPNFPYIVENTKIEKEIDLTSPQPKKNKFVFVLLLKKNTLKTNKGAFVINPKMDSG